MLRGQPRHRWWRRASLLFFWLVFPGLLPLPVAALTNDAAFISQAVPRTLQAGQTVSVSVTMRNTGTTTWDPAANHFLGSQNPENNWTWGLPRVGLDGPVGPGQRKTFRFTITAPSTPGTYNFQWGMLQEYVEWFGDFSPNIAVAVAGPTDGAAVVSANLPTSLTCGASFRASVTMRNTGTSTWTSDVYRLGAVGDSDPLGPGRVPLPPGVSVPPNGTYTFAFTLTAPRAPGSYHTDWQMVHEGVRWFGGVASRTVQVACPSDGAAVVSANLPTSLTCGASFTASVTMRNTGTSTWTSDVYRLGAVGDSDPLGPGRVPLPPGVSVPTNGTLTFGFTLTAPTAPGSYLTEWQMVHEGVRWFGDVASSVVEVSCLPERPMLPLSVVGNRFYAGHEEVKLIGGAVCCEDYPANGWPFISTPYIERFRENKLKYVHIRTGPFIRSHELQIFEGYRWIPDQAASGRGRYDLNQFAPAFVKHLRATLDATLAAGIYTEIDLVDAWSPRHRVSPFNAENNINNFDTGASGCELFRSVPHPFVEAWVRHIVRATADYPHVLYQVGNETAVCRSKPEFELGIYAIAKDEMGRMGVYRPVGTNSSHNGLDYRAYHGFFVPAPESIPVLVNETDNEQHAPEEYADLMRLGLERGGVYFQGWRGPLDQLSFETLLGLIRNIMDGTP